MTSLTKSTLMIALVSFASVAQAYIPHSSTISNRLTKTHGKGFYAIEQEVQFRTSAEPLILRERWVIENGENLRMSVSSAQTARGTDPIRYEAIYHDGQRTVTDPAGGTKTLTESSEFIESFFHARSGRTFLSELVRAKIIPLSFMKERPKFAKPELYKSSVEPLVRLGRTGGSVAWIFGEPSPAEGKLNPQAWIEQDAFLLRRLRFPTDAELSADRYTSYAGGFKFPRERTITWDNNSVTIRVISVKAINGAAALKTMDPSLLNTVKYARLPDVQQVREFYTRFR